MAFFLSGRDEELVAAVLVKDLAEGLDRSEPRSHTYLETMCIHLSPILDILDEYYGIFLPKIGVKQGLYYELQ